MFLLDDHELVREGIRSLLESDPEIEVVGEASTGAEALTRVPLAKPDVAILDVRLEDGNGIEVCRDLRSSMPELACLMLTSFADDEAMYASVMAGAAGYVLKQIKARDLIDDVKKVAAGASLMDPRAVARVVERIANPPKGDPGLASLSPQEARLLDLIADGKTNKEAAAALMLSEHTIKNRVTGLLRKLEVNNRTEAAIYATKHKNPGLGVFGVVGLGERSFEVHASALEFELETVSFDLGVREIRRCDVDAPSGGQADERAVIGDLARPRPSLTTLPPRGRGRAGRPGTHARDRAGRRRRGPCRGGPVLPREE